MISQARPEPFLSRLITLGYLRWNEQALPDDRSGLAVQQAKDCDQYCCPVFAAQLGSERGRQGSEERFEGFGEEMQSKMRKGFLALANEFPERCAVIDGGRDVESIAHDVARVASERLA